MREMNNKPSTETKECFLKAKWFRQIASFGAVGLGGVVVNMVAFNILLLTVLTPDKVENGPVWAAALAPIPAILFNWAGNRYWVFKGLQQRSTLREGIEFFAVSIAGSMLQPLCVLLFNNVLGLNSPLLNNVANAIGLGLGTAFRFLGYRFWVFSPKR